MTPMLAAPAPQGRVRLSWSVTLQFKLAALGVLAFWLWVWRIPIWSHDDLGFANRSREHFGGIVWGRLGHFAWDDLMHRNGRLADMVVQFVMSTRGFIGPLVALVCASQVWALWLLLREVAVASSDRKTSQAVWAMILIAGLALPMTLVGIDEALAGNTVMFLSATVGYIGGAALACLGLVAIMRLPGSRSWMRSVWTVLLVIAAGLHHELIALMMVGAVAALVVTVPSDRRSVPFLASSVLIIVASLARYGAGGLWARQARIGAPFDHQELGAVDRLLPYAAHSLSESTGRYGGVYLMALLGVVCLGLVADRQGQQRSRIALGLVVVAAVLVAGVAARVRFLAHRSGKTLAVYSSSTSVLLVLAMVVVVLAGAVVCWQARRVAGGVQAGAVYGAAAGALAVPAALGVPGGRTFYLALFMMLIWVVTAALVSGQAAAGKAVSWCSLLLLAAVIGPAIHAAPKLVTAVDANVRAWAPSLKQIEQVRQGKRDTITVPKQLPAPLYASDYFALHTKYYQPRLMFYYDLPESTPVLRR